MTRARRSLLLPALLALLLAAGLASAHQELLFAELSSEPPVPPAGEPFDLRLRLTDSANRVIEGVDLVLEIYEDAAQAEEAEGPPAVEGQDRETAGDSGVEPQPLTTVDLAAAEEPGIYRGRAGPLRAQSYGLRLVEIAGGSAEATASGAMAVGGDQPLEVELVLPPTQAGLGAWLLWLVGLPLLAGVVVALLVLTGRERSDSE